MPPSKDEINRKETDLAIKNSISHYDKLIIWSCDKEDVSSNQYSTHLVTIAGVMLAFLASTAKYFEINNGDRVIIVIIFLLYLLSLIFGIIYHLQKKGFLKKWINIYETLYDEWNKVKKYNDIKKIKSLEEKLLNSDNTSPQLALGIQTIFLILSFVLLAYLYIKYLL